MWEPRRLITPWACTVCYRDNFYLPFTELIGATMIVFVFGRCSIRITDYPFYSRKPQFKTVRLTFIWCSNDMLIHYSLYRDSDCKISVIRTSIIKRTLRLITRNTFRTKTNICERKKKRETNSGPTVISPYSLLWCPSSIIFSALFNNLRYLLIFLRA
jgi:hypothetical protein